jgi:hypothetical protein
MGDRAAARVAWSLFGLCAVSNAAGMAMAWARGESPWLAAFVVGFMVTPAVGALVASRRRQNAIGWLLLALGVGFAVANVATEYPAFRPERDLPVRAVVGLVGTLAFWATVNIGAIWILLLFPDGRRLPGRWRYVSWLAAAAFPMLLAGFAVKPGDLDLPATAMDNPFGVAELRFVESIGVLLLVLSLIGALLSFIVRFRRSGGVERQQMKGVVFVGTLLVVTTFTLGILDEFGRAPFAVELFAYGLLYAGLPASIGAAVLRYRLYDIDVIINRAVVYGSLTAATVASYLTLVVGLGWAVRAVSGQGANELTVAATTLIVAALFQPARRRIQSLVDRRFYRSRYDAARTLEAFQSRVRDRTDLEALRRELLSVVEETLQPTRAWVWLRQPGERR